MWEQVAAPERRGEAVFYAPTPPTLVQPSNLPLSNELMGPRMFWGWTETGYCKEKGRVI